MQTINLFNSITMKRLIQKRKITGATLFCLTFLFILASSCDPKPPKGSRAYQAIAGKEHFTKYCVQCHGEDGKGIVIDTLNNKPADLTQIVRNRRSSEFPTLEVANIIDGRKSSKWHKNRDMPLWGDVFSKVEYLEEKEIKGKLAEIIAYLMIIQD